MFVACRSNFGRVAGLIVRGSLSRGVLILTRAKPLAPEARRCRGMNRIHAGLHFSSLLP
jgi:hypothetical protein